MSRTFGRRRNSGDYEHPEGAPDPQDSLKWPPDERDPEPPRPDDGRPFAEQLHDIVDPVMREIKLVEAKVRSCLLSQGLPELYAEIAAAEIAEGWANGDPAPLWTMPGYVAPHDEKAARAWEEKWDEERGRSKPRENPSRRWELLSIRPSQVTGKKHAATFRDRLTGRRRTSHFGEVGSQDFTTHKDPERKRRYLNRHGVEGMADPTDPRTLSRWLLWNKPTLEASLRDFKRRFGL